MCDAERVQGALVASTGVTALQLPALEDCHYVARGGFVMSLILSLLSVFFSGLQQSSFGGQTETGDLRTWLASGTFLNENTMKTELRSSMVSHMILQAPFEIVVMSITLFIVGLGTYLGSSWKFDLPLSTGSHGNRGVLIAFIIPTVFVLLMYGHMMGLKDRELVKAADAQLVAEQLVSKATISDDVEALAKQDLGKQVSVRAEAVGSEWAALRQALHAAADAQRKCAEANMEIAKQYECLLGHH
jgi:hypothetical protein